jgi:undecaprenyl-diphosphatase
VELVKAILLGLVQGLTEFLPVSSSGHLVIGSEILNFQDQGVVFDVFLHLGTLVSVIIVFRSEITAMVAAPFRVAAGRHSEADMKFLMWDLYIIVATLPAVIVGLFFKDLIEVLFSSIVVVYMMLIVTGITMILARHLPEKESPMTWWRALIVGVAQACAILPGLSRSGSTIFAGIALGIPRQTIARFSFIMSIPAILGAAVLQFGALLEAPPTVSSMGNIFVGTCMAAISGYLAIKLLLDIIEKNRLQWFGYYCLAIAAIGLAHHYII